MASDRDVVLLDTNVLMDVLTEREPFYAASQEVWTLCETGAVRGVVSAISFNNVFYLVRKWGGNSKAYTVLRTMRDVFDIVALDEQLLHQAISAGFSDFEDAIQYKSAVRAQAAFIVTRNARDFTRGGTPVVSPEDYLAQRA